MPTIPPTTPPPGLPSITGAPGADADPAGPPKAGKRTRYIENNQIGSSIDRLRQLLGRYWVAGDPPTSPGTRGSRAEYGVHPTKMPIIVKVSKTSAVDKSTDCPFVKYKNYIRIEPNPDVFKGVGSGPSASDSFQVFLYGGAILARDFTPYYNLSSTEFVTFCELYEISGPRPPIPTDILQMEGILESCGDFGGMTVRDSPQQPPDSAPDSTMFTGDVTGLSIEVPELDIFGQGMPQVSEEAEYTDDSGLTLEAEVTGDLTGGGYTDDSGVTLDVEVTGDLTGGEGVIDPPAGCCDTTFEIVTPFSQFALDHFDLQSNVMFSGLTFSYNYTNEVYNIFTTDPDKEEKDLPNLYLTLEDAKAGRFLKTAKSKDVCSYNVDHLIEVPTGYKNILSPAKSSVVLPDAVPYSEYFPYHSDLQFTTDRDAEFADILAKRSMEGHMLRRFNEPLSYPCAPTPSTVPEERTRNMGVDTVIIESDVVKKTINTKARPFYNINLPAIDFCEWFDSSAKCFDTLSEITPMPENTRIIGPKTHSKVFADPDRHAGTAVSVLPPARAYEFNLLKYLAAEYANKHFGGYRELLKTGINHSETIAYKVMKWDAETYDQKKNDPAGTYQPLQRFYFSNTSDLDYVHYIDTQIKYNKRYVYETKAYQLVLGTRYRYDRCVSWFRGALVPEEYVPEQGGTLTRKYLPWYWFKILKTIEDSGPPAGMTPQTFEALIQSALREWVERVAVKHPGYINSFPGKGEINDCEDSKIIYQIEEREDVGLFVRIGCICRPPSRPNPGPEDPQPPVVDIMPVGLDAGMPGAAPIPPGGIARASATGYVQGQQEPPAPNLPHEIIDVISEPCIRVYETPYTIFDGRLVEQPPVRPLVDLVPYRAVNNQMLINLSNGMGVESQIPIYINPGEQLVTDERLRTEGFFRQKVDYKSHPGGLPPAGFEIYRMTDPPKNYQDFSGHLRAFVSTDFDKLSRQAADSASFIDDMVPNQKYYYTFRTIGSYEIYEKFTQYTGMIQEARAGEPATTFEELAPIPLALQAVEGLMDIRDRFSHLFSNPTPVYEVELVDDDGAIYLLIRVVDFDILHPPPTHKTMKRLLHIKPSIAQSVVDTRFNDIVGANATTAYDAVGVTNGRVPLGVEAEKIWGKTFKVRLTSKETCRKLDLNVKFDTRYIKIDDCKQVSIVGVPYDDEEA
jgi:hypothetical protein